MKDDIWTVSRTINGAPTLVVGEFLEALPPNAFLPAIGQEMIEFGTFLLRACADNHDLPVEKSPEEENFDFA